MVSRIDVEVDDIDELEKLELYRRKEKSERNFLEDSSKKIRRAQIKKANSRKTKGMKIGLTML